MTDKFDFHRDIRTCAFTIESKFHWSWKIITRSKSKRKSSRFTRHNFDLSKLREWKTCTTPIPFENRYLLSFNCSRSNESLHDVYSSRSRPPVPTAFSPRAEKKKIKKRKRCSCGSLVRERRSPDFWPRRIPRRLK